MNNKRYHIIFTGQLVAGVNASTARSNLILDLGLSEEQANALLARPGVLLKRLPTQADALRLVAGFERAGVVCVVEDHGAEPPPAGSGDSALISALRRYVPAMRRRA